MCGVRKNYGIAGSMPGRGWQDCVTRRACLPICPQLILPAGRTAWPSSLRVPANLCDIMAQLILLAMLSSGLPALVCMCNIGLLDARYMIFIIEQCKLYFMTEHGFYGWQRTCTDLLLLNIVTHG